MQQRVSNENAPFADRPDDVDVAMRQELLEYLREHPHAMDSLEGVVEWWLPRHTIRITVERVARALEALTRDGHIEKVSDGEHVWYRLRARPLPE